jgi:fatty acid desaturase
MQPGMTRHAPPLAWALMALIAAGFITSGIGIMIARPWLFFTGVGVIVVGVVVSWLTHIVSASSQTSERPIRGETSFR